MVGEGADHDTRGRVFSPRPRHSIVRRGFGLDANLFQVQARVGPSDPTPIFILATIPLLAQVAVG